MSALLDDSLVIVLAGGAGERLYPLTKERAKPAVYFGGPYRIIDFALSNCINSGLRRIFIATQYKSLSLNRHIRMGWGIVSEELGEFVEILPPQKRVSEHWYQGTADAVYQNLYSIMRENPRTWSCSPATTSTRWTTRACCGSIRSGARRSRSRRSRCRSPTRAGSASSRSTKPSASPASRRSRSSRPRSRARPISRWRRWASTSSTPTCWCARSRPTRTSRPTTTSARTSSRR